MSFKKGRVLCNYCGALIRIVPEEFWKYWADNTQVYTCTDCKFKKKGEDSMNNSILRKKIKKAFGLLRPLGYQCEAKFSCCQNCGLHALEEGVDKYLFWHDQDDTVLRESGILRLCWGGDGEEILKALEDAGLEVDWNGSDKIRFVVTNPKPEEKTDEPRT